MTAASVNGMATADRVDRRRNRWANHNVERRRHILDAAVAVIEDEPPGAEIHVQQIATKAGLVRTVVYRHFDGRADLNRAVQAHITAMIRESVESQLTLDGSVEDIIERTITSFISWVAEHPNLYLTAERELGDGSPGELLDLLQSVADRTKGIIRFGAELLGHRFTELELATLDAAVFGIIGQVRGTVGAWIRRPDRIPKPQVLVDLLCRSIWYQVDAMARSLDLHVDPSVPLRQLLADAPT